MEEFGLVFRASLLLLSQYQADSIINSVSDDIIMNYRILLAAVESKEHKPNRNYSRLTYSKDEDSVITAKSAYGIGRIICIRWEKIILEQKF